jgi:ribosomal protein S18 acetylase RimI-like enzyme
MKNKTSKLKITLEKNPKRKDIKFLYKSLGRYNLAQTGKDDWRPFGIFLRDKKGKIVGGLYGESWYGWLEINFLWLREDQRGKGIGKRLIQMAEKEGLKRKCKYARLDTFSFQAPEFYKKLGYKVFEVLKDYPEEHKRYSLKKRLTPA